MPVAILRHARRSDRGAISVFECAEPPKPEKSAATGWKLAHPRQWEYEAQQMIRGLAKRVPAAAPLRVFVAEDDDGLAAVVSWREVSGPAEIHLDVVGIARRHRRRGGGFARALVRAVLSEIEAAAIDAGADELYLEGEIFNLNDASLRLTSDFKFDLLEEHATGAQTWSLKVPLAGVEPDDDPDAEDEPA